MQELLEFGPTTPVARMARIELSNFLYNIDVVQHKACCSRLAIMPTFF